MRFFSPYTFFIIDKQGRFFCYRPVNDRTSCGIAEILSKLHEHFSFYHDFSSECESLAL